MPRGSVPKRERKKPKKKKDEALISPVIATSEVQLIAKKKRKPKDEDF